MNFLAWAANTWKANTWRAGTWVMRGGSFVRSPFRTFIVKAESRRLAIGVDKRDQKPVA